MSGSGRAALIVDGPSTTHFGHPTFPIDTMKGCSWFAPLS